MSLEEEIGNTRKEIISDGYDMSIGEVMNLYREDELVINPAFQRLYRWDITRKTRFIESLLLGIPIPPIFVVQDENGIWELIDGLQRLSTVFEFSGILKDSNKKPIPPSTLEGTAFLPSLSGKQWENDNPDLSIGKGQQLEIKRARLRVEILKKESDPKAKYELFQRLNTGGSVLTPQEVRNCVAVMIDPTFYQWLHDCADLQSFITTISQTELALEQQIGMELALRFFAFRNIKYDSRLDVHEYLDSALEKIASDQDFDRHHEQEVFRKTFDWLNEALGSSAFKAYNPVSGNFAGKFLMSCFEVTAYGVSQNISALEAMDQPDRVAFIREKAEGLVAFEPYANNSGGGIRGTTRLANLLPIAPGYYRP